MTEARYRRITWAALALAVLVGVPSLGLGLVFDDYGHRAFLLRHLAHGGADSLDMFDVCGRRGPLEIAARVHAGALPWWTLPDLSIALFRPLSVLTHYLDYALWPDTPALMHAHNVALYVAIVSVVAALYRRLLGVGAAAALSLLLFAVDDAHADSVAWIAGRNTLLSALFTVLTLLLHDVARRDGSRWARWLAPLSLLLAFASGEGAIAVWAFLVPYALWLDRDQAWRRLWSLLPLGLLTLVWNVLYRAAGYGVRGSGFYRDPLDSPWHFVSQRLPEVWPSLLREQLTVPGLLLSQLGALRTAAVFHGFTALAIAGLVLVGVQLRGRREVRFWLLSLALSLVPPSAAGGHPRLLLLPGVAAFGLCAEVVLWLVACARSSRSIVRRRTLWSVAGLLVLVHGPLALACAPLASRELARVSDIVEISTRMLPHGEQSTGARVFVLDTPTYFGTMLAGIYRDPREPPIELHVLCSSGKRVLLTRVAEDSFTLEPDGGFLAEPTSWLVRAPERPFERGQRIVTARFEATVLALRPDGRPARVRFRVPELADPRSVLMRWHGQRYERVQLPPVGQRVWLLP